MRTAHTGRDTLTRDRYIEDLKQRTHFEVVNCKAGASCSTDVQSWTNRTTGCDVISLVTTSRPFLNGAMKDLHLKLEKAHNVKPNPGTSGASVYTKALHPDSDHSKKERQMMNKILHTERDNFFRRLKAARVARSTYETTAAVVIQAIIRGYMVRKHMLRFKCTCDTIRELRLRLRRVISANSDVTVPKLSVYRKNYKSKRAAAALAIQSAFRLHIGRRVLQRKRVEKQMKATKKSVLVIQKCGRRYNAQKRVSVIRERKNIALRVRAVIRIQTAVRRKLAGHRTKKRKYIFQWLAARMIQNFYRHVFSKRKAHSRRAGMVQRRRARGALAMQQAARAYMSKLRTGRIRDRKNFLRSFNTVTKIVTIVRGFICRRRVVKLRMAKEIERQKAAKELQAEIDRKAVEETRALLEDSDLFFQARKGNVTEVDDIFTGLMSDEPHEPTEVDNFGDTVLLIASSLGHMEIVRKCLMWGFDINFRNENTGYSAVSLAAQNQHFDVVQYLLSPPIPKSSKKKSGKEVQVPSIVWSPDDVAIVLTSVAHHSNNVSLMSTLIEKLGPTALTTRHPDTGETALHAAFRSGNKNMVSLLLKYAADEVYDLRDDNGKTLYHCAAESSVELLQLLAELDPAMAENKDELLLKKLKEQEHNGKSGLLIAALYGQGDVLQLTKDLEGKTAVGEDQDGEAEIGWSPADIDAAIKTAHAGHVTCIRFLIEAGFDPSWANDDTGKSIVMESCQAGQLQVLDSLMQAGTSFIEVDTNGRTAVHYACMCTSENVLSFLLSHARASKCGIDGMSLAIEDKRGLTPLHIAAEFGCDLSVDLLAQDGIAIAINKGSSDSGMTPLMVAAANGNIDVLSRLMVLDADVKQLDSKGHTALWYLLQSSAKAPGSPSKRLSLSSAGLELVRAGCPVISTLSRSLADWRDRKTAIEAGKLNREDMEVIELLSVDKNSTFLRALPKLLDPQSCWEAVLAAVALDNSDGVLYNALMAGGANDVMLKLGGARYLSSSGGSSQGGSAVTRIMDIIYKGFTLHGWAIIFNNVGLLMKFLDKFPLSSEPLDLEGNTALHIAACYSSPDMMDAVLGTGRILVEATNNKGNTALMESMCVGSLKSLLKLAKAVADPRRGLGRRYDAWLLAIVRRRELNEKNLQTGKIQEDDENVCPMAPDPDYLFWYKHNT